MKADSAGRRTTPRRPRLLGRLAFLLVPLAGAALACSLGSPLVLRGAILTEEGSPPEAAYVALLSVEDFEPAAEPAMADEAGRYEIEAPGGGDYLLVVVPLSGQREAGYGLHGHTPQMAWLKAAKGELRRDFTLVPCHDFILEGYRPDGTLVLNDGWVGVRFAEDMQGAATMDIFFGADKGEGTPSVPSVCVPLRQKRRFFLQWQVPGFGNVVLAADNAGSGYAAGDVGGTVLNLNLELARSQVARLRRNLERYRDAGYDIPTSSLAELAQAEALLEQAAGKGGAAGAALADQATAAALWALETLEGVRAGQDIPRYRMGELIVTVLDAAGDPVPGATVSYQQTSHDFLFGIFDTLQGAGMQGFDRMREAGINYLTMGFYWNETEPQQDRIDWDRIDHAIGVADLAEKGFRLKAHALLALWDFATPSYLKDMPFEEFEREVDEHVTALVGRYRDQIDIWNVINEAHGRGAALEFDRRQITKLTRTAIRAVRAGDPGARIIINNAFDWFGESRPFLSLMRGSEDDFTLPVPEYLDQLEAQGVDYDIIGQQLYNGGYVSLFAEWGLGDPMGVPTWDLAHLSAILDRLEEYGKPVHVTEQSVPSTWDPQWTGYGAGWWHRPWDEETQADFLRQFYTLAFSKPQVEAITWWGISDRDSFIVAGGLLDEEGDPKPAYYALRDLIQGWTSSGRAATDAAGRVTIRGYGGEYRLTVTDGARTWSGTLHLWEQQQTEWVVRLPGE